MSTAHHETCGGHAPKCYRQYLLLRRKEIFMKRVYLSLVAGVATLCLVAVTGVAVAADIHSQPPANFKKVSTLVKLPEYLAGLGVLYVDPSTLPVGPFPGSDQKHHLVNVTYIVP